MAETAEQVRVDFEKSTGTPVFLIASGREIASEIGFYLRDKRREFPDHREASEMESISAPSEKILIFIRSRGTTDCVSK